MWLGELVHFLHSELLYTRFAFCGLVVERRLINLEFLRLLKDQRTVHTALGSKAELVSTPNPTGMVVLDNTAVKVRIMIS